MTISMLQRLSIDELQRLSNSGHKCADMARIVLTLKVMRRMVALDHTTAKERAMVRDA